MPSVFPFRALRPVASKAHLVSARASGSESEEELMNFLDENPLSYLHIVKPYLHFHEHRKSSKFYPFAHDYFEKLKNDGVLVEDEKDSFYIYRQTDRNRNLSYTGLICTASVEDYKKGKIKKHEKTRTYKEERLIEHMSAVHAVGEPVLLTYSESPKVTGLLDKMMMDEPLLHFTSEDNLEHTIWVCDQKVLNAELSESFSEIASFYIADGHHRIAASSKYLLREDRHHHLNPEKMRFMCYLISDRQLRIYPFHRILYSHGCSSDQEFLQNLKRFFIVNEESSLLMPATKFQFGLMLDSGYYSLSLRDDVVPEGILQTLDVTVVEKLILQEIAGIADSQTDDRIGFYESVKGNEGLESMVKEGKCQAVITLGSVQMEELFLIADEHLVMPPKSTWIEPKLRTGLIIQQF